MSRFTRSVLPPLLVFACLVALPGTASGREVPIGLANTSDQNLRDSNWLYAIRFVVGRDTTMYRFFSQMKAKGASWDEHPGPKCSTYGPGCYGAGDGGIIQARLVTIKPDGTPDLSSVLAQETVNPARRYLETKTAYGISTISLFWYFNMGGVQVKAGTPYAMVYRNVHADPAHNFSSANSPAVKDSESGPNGRNNMDPSAPGAIAGLDPREAVAWSTNAGRTWSWGRQVGPYYGSTTSDDGTRLPHYAWQSSPGSRPQANQPYSAYMTTCSGCSLTLQSAPRAATLTQAGGYAPVGKSVGVVTVRNMRTGRIGRTPALGSGIARGPLDPPVAVEVGDSYQISHTGTVYLAEADNYAVRIAGLGSGAFSFTTAGYGADVAELFALPHPWYEADGTAAAAPVVETRRGRRRKFAHRLRVRVRRASFGRRARTARPSRAGRHRVVRRLRVRGYVAGARGRRRPVVAINVRRRGHWRTVGRRRVRRNGSFVLRKRVRMLAATRAVRVRAKSPGGPRSRSVRVRTRH